jgi:hypothetical protein
MNTKLKVTFLRSYRSKQGTVTFVYKVTGSAEAMEQYKEVQGSFYREDETTGEVLYFTTRYMGATGNILITANDKIVADMSEFEKAASLVGQFSGVFAEKLAEASVRKLLGGAPAAESGADNDIMTP